MNTLKLKDRKIFDRFINLKGSSLSCFSFANVFIWSDVFDISWEFIDENLCIFMKDSIGCFMYLPPLGSSHSENVLEKCFCTMEEINNGSGISRIENIDKEDVSFFRDTGLTCRRKDGEYVYLTEELCNLKGDSYKKKRSARNYFLKNYNFRIVPFSSKYTNDCTALYERWAKSRSAANDDSIFQQMLKDSYTALSRALEHYGSLDLQGKIVLVDGMVAGFSIGYAVSKDTFCIIFEITDLKIKGLSQFLFWDFSKDKKEFRYINAMDDSGLDSLRKVKLSYRPHKIEPVFIASKN